MSAPHVASPRRSRLKIRILNIYFHPDPTGTGLTIAELARDLARRGHDVSVVTSVSHYGLESAQGERAWPWSDEEWEGVRVRRTPVYVARRRTALTRLLNYVSYALLALPAGLGGPRPDVILGSLPPVTTGLAAWLASRLLGAPLVLAVHDVYPDVIFKRGWLARMNRALDGFLLRRASIVVALSEGQRDTLVARGSDPERTRVIPIWTDLDGIRPEPKQNRFRAEHAGDTKLLALYAGNLGTLGGVGVILETAHMLRDDPRIRFLIVGRGNARDDLVRRARELDLPNLRFLPTQPRERLAEMLAAADVGLVTLDPRVATGSVPSKAFTIMAAGRPVLAAIDERNQVAAEIRHAECGEVVPPNGVNEMAKTLRGWADDPLTLDALGSRGRRWAERFHDRESAVREYEGLFARIAGPKREEEPRRPTRTC